MTLMTESVSEREMFGNCRTSLQGPWPIAGPSDPSVAKTDLRAYSACLTNVDSCRSWMELCQVVQELNNDDTEL